MIPSLLEKLNKRTIPDEHEQYYLVRLLALSGIEKVNQFVVSKYNDFETFKLDGNSMESPMEPLSLEDTFWDFLRNFQLYQDLAFSKIKSISELVNFESSYLSTGIKYLEELYQKNKKLQLHGFTFFFYKLKDATQLLNMFEYVRTVYHSLMRVHVELLPFSITALSKIKPAAKLVLDIEVMLISYKGPVNPFTPIQFFCLLYKCFVYFLSDGPLSESAQYTVAVVNLLLKEFPNKNPQLKLMDQYYYSLCLDPGLHSRIRFMIGILYHMNRHGIRYVPDCNYDSLYPNSYVYLLPSGDIYVARLIALTVASLEELNKGHLQNAYKHADDGFNIDLTQSPIVDFHKEICKSIMVICKYSLHLDESRLIENLNTEIARTAQAVAAAAVAAAAAAMHDDDAADAAARAAVDEFITRRKTINHLASAAARGSSTSRSISSSISSRSRSSRSRSSRSRSSKSVRFS